MFKPLSAVLLSVVCALLLGCGGSETPVASSPEAAAGPPGAPGAPGPPGAPGAPGAPGDGSEMGSADGSGEDPNAEMPAEGQPGDEGQPGGEGAVPGENPDGSGENPDGTSGEDPAQAYGDSPEGGENGDGQGRPRTVFGRLSKSLLGVAGPIIGGPNLNGEGPNGEPGGDPGFEGGGEPGFEGDPSMRSKPKTLAERAAAAFKRGQDQQGFIWLYAQYLAPRGGEARLVDQMRWAQGLRKPALAQRYGLGVIYNAPREFTGDPQPISDRLVPTDTGDAPRGRRRRGDDNGGGGQQGFEPFAQNGDASQLPPGAAGRLAYYTGDTGTKLVDALKKKFAAGDLGLAMVDVYRVSDVPVDPNNPNPDESNPDFAGDPGADFGAGGDGAGGEGGGRKNDEKVAQIAPGILWLGTGTAKDLEQRAAEHNLDVIVMYDVTIRPSQTGTWVNNTTKFRIANLKLKETIYSSTLLNNVKVIEQRKRNKGSGKDEVDEDIEKAAAAIDAKVKVGPFPSGLKPEHVLARLSALAADPQLDLLPALTEARFYQAKGLLPDKDFEQFAASTVTAERLMPILTQIQAGGVPLEMFEIIYRLSPDLGLQLMEQMSRRGALRK